ncbi:hypothetical protein RCL_jg18129.t1 [Rhizophagus clarus]|uniref:Uncharacterized protein n=1 Tax=Rhizophagus clarus TaxID=94130 RepID=A0A8H3LG31_9GLOM|nr:hypothetical protein RCL_jg18129.t1 [Rhizophagus clarus]
MEPYFSTAKMSSLQLRLAKEEMFSTLKYQTKALLLAANIIGTLCYLSSTVFLDSVIFSILDQLSREMEKQIEVINKSHQSELEAATNKGKSVCIDPPDDFPKMEIDTEVPHQSNAVQSTQSL